MFDFIITAIISIFTNMYVIVPYWDRLRDVLLQQGIDKTEVMQKYYLLCGTSYLAVGFIVYFIILLIKFLYNKYS